MEVIFRNEYDDIILTANIADVPSIGNAVDILDERYYVRDVVWNITANKSSVTVVVSETKLLTNNEKISKIKDTNESVNATRIANQALKQTKSLKGAVADLQNRPVPTNKPRPIQ